MKIIFLLFIACLFTMPVHAQEAEDLTGKQTPVIERDETGAIIDRDDEGREVYTGEDGLFSDPHEGHDHGDHDHDHNHFYEQPKTILDIARDDSNFSTFIQLVELAELTDALEGEGPFTAFVPADFAFSNLPATTLKALQLPENKNKLKSILENHVVSGIYLTTDIENGVTELQSLNGQTLTLIQNAFGLTVNGIKVIGANTTSQNGVVHIIDTVIIAPTTQE